MRQAVVLVGGKGSRLGGVSGGIPKPFLEVQGRPFVDYILDHLKCQGILEIILLAGYGAEWVSKSFTSTVSGMTLHTRVEAQPMGTAGALLSAADILDEEFLLLNGDSIFSANWSSLFPLLTEGVAIALAVRHVSDVSRYGKVVCKGTSVIQFSEKSVSGPGEINAGIYAIRRDRVLPLIKGPMSFEVDIIPKLVANKEVKAAVLQGYFIDIGLPDTLSGAREDLSERLRVPAVIFDRDNTLVKDKGYTYRVEDLEWMDGARKAVLGFNTAGYKVFVATNQAGISRGLYREEDMHIFHRAMQSSLHEIGAHIDGFYHCPHHVEGVVKGLNIACKCRKPEVGMLDKMFTEHTLDKVRSLMIGDKRSDVDCGEAFGLTSYLFNGPSLHAFCSEQGLFA